ncbi:hypothetical protein OY671_009489, partial [Metschnikowia pulcherrima]
AQSLYSPSAVRSHSRASVQARAFPRIDAYYADSEQQDWSLPASQISAYSEAVLSGTLFDYSTVPYPQAADFLQAWIAACPDSYHAHSVSGNFCFGRAADIRGFGWADSVTQDRWIGAASACETAADALLKAMTSSPRPTSTEPQRNAIRWIGSWDESSDFPESEETQAVQTHRQAFESFSQ